MLPAELFGNGKQKGVGETKGGRDHLSAGIVMIGFVLPGMQRTSNTYNSIYLRILTLGEWMIVARALIGTIRRDRSWGWTVWLVLLIGLPVILGGVVEFGRRSPQGDALSRELLRWMRPIVDYLWPWLT